MLDWRRKVELTFPVIRYHPPLKQISGAIATRSDALVDAPLTIWGQKDWSQDYYRHGGRGLSRNAWHRPSRKSVLPGGVVDSNGLHVPILDIDAPEDVTTSFLDRLFQIPPFFFTFQYRFHFGEPEQLTLDQHKSMMIDLNKQERHMPKVWRKIDKAESHFDVIAADVPPAIMQVYYGPVQVKNWIDVPRRNSLDDHQL